MTTEPKYITIKNDLIERIKEGQFPDGKLPSIKNIAEEYNVSLMTANQTVKGLKNSGIVVCYPDNRGTVIVEKKINFLRESKDFTNLMENVKVYAKKKIKLRFFNPEYFSRAKDLWDGIIEAFQSRYPWVEIEILSEQNLNNLIDGNEHPDVMQLIGRDVGFWQKQGLIISLKDFVTADSSPLSKIHHKALENSMVNDELFALPMSIGIPLLFYRKDIFDKLSINCDELVKSGWDGIRNVSDRLTGGKYETAIRLGLWSCWNSLIGNTSKEIFNTSHNSTLIKSIETLKNFYARSSYFLYGSGPKLEDDFFRAKGAMFLGYSSFMCDFKRYPKWHIAKMPLEKTGILTSETCVNCICSKSRQREEAWLFIKYLSSEETQRKIAEAKNNLPIHLDVLSEINKYPEFKNINIQSTLEKSERLSINSQILYILYESIIDPVLEVYFADKLPASSVFEIIRPRISEVLKVYLNKGLGNGY